MQSTPFREKDRICALFSAEHGLARAVAYGAAGAHSALRIMNNPLCVGTVYLYMQKPHALGKVIDFVPLDTHSFIMSNLDKYLHATLWSEIIVATYGSGGEEEKSYRLFLAALQAMRQCKTSDSVYLASARFIWKYLLINGICPDIYHCAVCHAPLTMRSGCYIDAHTHSIMCADCYHSVQQHDATVARPFPPALYQFLTTDLQMPFEQLVENRQLSPLHAELWNYIIAITEHSLERPLKSLPVLRAIAR